MEWEDDEIGKGMRRGERKCSSTDRVPQLHPSDADARSPNYTHTRIARISKIDSKNMIDVNTQYYTPIAASAKHSNHIHYEICMPNPNYTAGITANEAST